MNYLHIISMTTNKDVLIFEQGLCQCIGSIFDDKKTDESFIRQLYDDLFPYQADRILVYVLIKKAILVKRIEHRKDKPFYFSSENMSTAIDNSIKTTKILCDCWVSKYGTKNLISVSNDEDGQSENVAKKIFDSLKGNGYI